MLFIIVIMISKMVTSFEEYLPIFQRINISMPSPWKYHGYAIHCLTVLMYYEYITVQIWIS